MQRAILFYVEDPGAANYAVPVAHRLLSRGASVRVVTGGHATAIVGRSNIDQRAEDPTKDARTILDESAAGLVVVGTSENVDSPGLKLVTEARARGIVTVGIVDHGANAAYRFRGRTSDALAYLPDWLLVTDQWTASEYEKLGVGRDRIVVTGHPHFDRLAAKKEALCREGKQAVRARTLAAAPLERPIFVFVSEISDGLNAGQYRRSPDYTLHGRGPADGRTEIVCEEFLDAIRQSGIKPAPFLVLRRHPKEPDAHLDYLIREFDYVSRQEDAIEVVFCADLVAGMSSILLDEAAFLDQRVLSIVPRESERHWLEGARRGVIPCATTRSELQRLLPALADADRNSSGRRAVRETKSATDSCEAFLLKIDRHRSRSEGMAG